MIWAKISSLAFSSSVPPRHLRIGVGAWGNGQLNDSLYPASLCLDPCYSFDMGFLFQRNS